MRNHSHRSMYEALRYNTVIGLPRGENRKFGNSHKVEFPIFNSSSFFFYNIGKQHKILLIFSNCWENKIILHQQLSILREPKKKIPSHLREWNEFILNATMKSTFLTLQTIICQVNFQSYTINSKYNWTIRPSSFKLVLERIWCSNSLILLKVNFQKTMREYKK